MRTLAANNHTALLIAELFPGTPSEFYGTVRITSDKPIVSTALVLLQGGVFATTAVLPLQ